MKHGKEGFDSYTEVDLLRSDTIVCVRRTINSDNKGSKWSIDGRKAAEKDVKLIMVELAIDVDNLCSFMPQDKVRTPMLVRTHPYRLCVTSVMTAVFNELITIFLFTLFSASSYFFSLLIFYFPSTHTLPPFHPIHLHYTYKTSK